MTLTKERRHIVFTSWKALVLAPVFAASLAAAALPAAASGLPNYSAGLIDPTGVVDAGTGFMCQHTATGTYVITFPNGTFTSFPIMTVTPFGVNGHAATAIISGETGSNGGASFTILLTDKVNKAKLVDNAFEFTLLAS
jgi:hypothetical protein